MGQLYWLILIITTFNFIIYCQGRLDLAMLHHADHSPTVVLPLVGGVHAMEGGGDNVSCRIAGGDSMTLSVCFTA